MKEDLNFRAITPAIKGQSPFLVFSKGAAPGSAFEKFVGINKPFEIPKELQPVKVNSKIPFKLNAHEVKDSVTDSIVASAVKSYSEALNASIDSGAFKDYFNKQSNPGLFGSAFVENFSQTCAFDFEVGKNQSLSSLAEKMKLVFPQHKSGLDPNQVIQNTIAK